VTARGFSGARRAGLAALGVAGVACAACVRLPFVHSASSGPAVRPASRAAQDDVDLLSMPPAGLASSAWSAPR
jgi:hypothetical protein